MSQIKVSDLTFSYPGSYDNVFENASFQIDTDWKLGFTGRNGRGKTTFLKLLMGEYPYQGHITASVCFDYFPFPVPHPDWLAGEAMEEVARMMLAVDRGIAYDALPEREMGVMAQFADPAQPTISATADAWTKIGAADQSLVGTRV